MGYSAANEALYAYRVNRVGELMGESGSSWFASMWGSIKAMLSTFSSDEENQEIAGKYTTATSDEKIPAHVKLDYVCAIRRDVRKQYVSGEDGLYTDVTPFRYGISSAHMARLFDSAMDQVIDRKAKT